MVRWLHLSDIHFSYDNHVNSHIKDTLIDYLHKLGEFDLVLITGDTAYQGKYGEDLADYITKLSEATKCDTKNFYHCIGNHDIKRGTQRTSIVTLAIKEYKDNDQKISDDNYDYLFSTGHKLYNEKIKELLPHMKDYQEVHNFVDKENYTITILNTCLFSHGKEDINNLYLLDGKFYDVLNNNKSKREGNKLNLAIGHHSYDWLNEDQQKSFCHYLEDSNIDLFLCGHNHNFGMQNLEDTNINQFTTGSIFSKDNEKVCILVGEYNSDKMSYSMELHSYSFKNNSWGIDINSDRRFINGTVVKELPRLNKVVEEVAVAIDVPKNKSNVYKGIETEIKKKAREFIGYKKELADAKKAIKNILENPDSGDYLFYHARELYGKSYFCAKLIYDLCYDEHTNSFQMVDMGVIFVDGKIANNETATIEMLREQASEIIGYPIEFEDKYKNSAEGYKLNTDEARLRKIVYELSNNNKKTIIIIDALNEINKNEIGFLLDIIPSGICIIVTSNIKIKNKKFIKHSRELKGFTQLEIKEILKCKNPKFVKKVYDKTNGCPMLILDTVEALEAMNGDVNKVNIRESGKAYFDNKIEEWKNNKILSHLLDIFGVFGYVAPLTLDQLQEYLRQQSQFNNVRGAEILRELENVKNQMLSYENNDSKVFKAYYSLFVDRINGQGTKKDLIENVKSITKWVVANLGLFDHYVLGEFYTYWVAFIEKYTNEIFLIEILKLLRDNNSVKVLEVISDTVLLSGNEISKITFEFFEKYCDEIDSEKIYRILGYVYSNQDKRNSPFVSVEKEYHLLRHLSSKDKYVWAKSMLGSRLVIGDNSQQDKIEGEKLLREAIAKGYDKAIIYLGRLLLNRDNSQQDKIEGENLLREAIAKGNDYAIYYLAHYRYEDNKKEEAAELFYKSMQQGEAESEINLAYMIRKGEYPLHMPHLNIKDLLTKHVFTDKPHIIASVNYALNIVGSTNTTSKWVEAQNILMKLDIYGKEELNNKIDWWYDLSKKGDVEGDLVIGWLSKLGLIDDIKEVGCKERFNRAIASGVCIPEWLLQ